MGDRGEGLSVDPATGGADAEDRADRLEQILGRVTRNVLDPYRLRRGPPCSGGAAV